MKTYAGIGSRKTPDSILQFMCNIASWLESNNYHLNSGGANGADSAFADGCGDKTLYIPWAGFNGTSANTLVGVSADSMAVAQTFHPAWDKLSIGAKKLMARNVCQILGYYLNDPVKFVICWTPDGAETSTSSATGGTGQAIRIAIANNIPVFNLANPSSYQRLQDALNT